MERLKNVQDVDLEKESKSWVASRFALVHDCGVAKRRCRYDDCTKEYSRGTSHMILKRHWSRQHPHFNPPSTPRTTNNHNPDTFRSPSKKKPLNPNNLGISGRGGMIIEAKTKSKANNQNIGSSNQTNNKILGNNRVQLDVKLVAKRLREATSIHLTLDVHLPKKGGKSYGIITAHSLSESMDIKSVLLEYRHLPYPDDTTCMYEFLRACIIKFNIREKIVSIASNCSTVIKDAIQELDKRYRLAKNFHFTNVHIKCFPQFIHMNVVEVLKTQETLIDSVRKVVGLINQNNFNTRPLQPTNSTNGAVLANNMDQNNSSTGSNESITGTIKLPFDNRSSWNTTYNMIETFIQQREFIEPTLLHFQNPQDLANITIDWNRLFTVVQFLKPFHEVINKFAVDNYAPVSLVAVSIPHLIDHLSSPTWPYDDLVMAALNFKLQLESYQQTFQSDLTLIASLLDPRVKDTFLSPETKNNAIDILRNRLNETPADKSPYSGNSLWSRIFRPCKYDEITDYLDSTREHGYTCNVAYWEAHKHVYPCLYVWARALVCVQATSVTNDRIFSAAEHIERERRQQVDSTNSKELMKSWAKYLEK